MNDYRVTYDTKNAVGQAVVTAIDEKDARRTFKEASETCAVITVIELIRENVPATKAQERKALEKIKAIVETLGPRSYIATALDGCLQDAEANIDDDAAYQHVAGIMREASWIVAERQSFRNITIDDGEEIFIEYPDGIHDPIRGFHL